MLRSWYVAVELHRTITTWEELSIFFVQTFSFQYANPEVHNALQIICDVVLKVIPVTYLVDPHVHYSMQSMMTCYNLSREPEDDDEVHNVIIPYLEGSHDVAAPDIPMDSMSQPLKIRRVNIGSEEHPKFSNIGVYWEEKTMAKIMDLLHEFQDLFLTQFLEMKGILGGLGEMKIPLKPDAKPMRQRPYRLNPRYKDHVKAEIDWMLGSSIL